MSVGNVHKSELSVVRLPDIAQEEDRGIKRCGTPNLVLADISDNSRYRNDITRVSFKVDELTVELEKENGEVILAPGLARNFPHQANAKGFMIDWRQLTKSVSGGGVILDAQCYKVKITYELAGTSGVFYFGAYKLLPFNQINSRDTVQVFTVLNDVVRSIGINYKDSGFAGSVRFKGTFGYMQPNFETNNITYADRTRNKVRIEALRSYELRTSQLVGCMTSQIDEQHLLAANQIWITEHHPHAHIQYNQFPVILSEDASPEIEYLAGGYAKLTAQFKDKVAVHESKYDGNIEAKINASFDLPQGVQSTGCADANVSINTNQVNDTIPSGGSKNFNLLDQNGDPINVDSVSGDDVSLNTHWVRNPDWLDLPEINIGDERFVGLYAVFEDDVDDNTITIDVGAGVSIDYGDGTVITSVAGTNTHNYDYATISSPILQTNQGYNYKMVIVDIDLTGVTDVILNQGLTDRPRRITGWLDIIAAGSTINQILISLTNSAYPAFIERFYVKEMNLTSSSNVGQVQMCSNLKVYEYPLLNSATAGFNSLFTYATNAGVRTNSGQPISINNNNSIDARTFCRYSGVDVLGDLNLPNALFNNAFQDSSIREVGYLTLTNVTDIQQIFIRTGVYKVGTITVGTSLTNIFRAFLATNLEIIVFSGDMSGVTNTSQAFNDCHNLRELLLPNITVGFDISDSQITGTPLQDLFTSLGTASGAQTITLPNFTIGEDTSIATGKGFTIAYA